MKIFYIAVAVFFILICVILFYGTYRINKEREELRRQIKEVEKESADYSKRQEEAAKEKQEANTGDHSVDVSNMVNSLHKHANK